jgi:uncharacterized DUF497 family protein
MTAKDLIRFEWDEEKNEINICKHSLDFADAWEIFESPLLTRIDDRFDEGEERWIRERVKSSTLTILGTMQKTAYYRFKNSSKESGALMFSA